MVLYAVIIVSLAFLECVAKVKKDIYVWLFFTSLVHCVK